MLLVENFYLLYFLVFTGTLIFSVFINTLLLKFSHNLGVRNHEIRWTSHIKPSLGGLSFYILFLFAITCTAILPVSETTTLNVNLLGLFFACSLGFLIGLADDAYNTKPMLKFLGQWLCANILFATDIYIQLTPDVWINYTITCLWVIGLMNSINMLDNMDGVTGSISVAIILAIISVMFLETGAFNPDILILLGVAGGISGFLVFNWHPSRMFMGDTGSQFLGAFLAAASMMYIWNFKNPTMEYFQIQQFMIPLLVFIMPIIDTTTVFIRRIGRGQSPFVGGRDHTTHHLAYLGISDGRVAAIFAGTSLFSIVLVWVLHYAMNDWSFWYSIATISYFVLLFGAFQVVYEKGKKAKTLAEAKDELEGKLDKGQVKNDANGASVMAKKRVHL